MFIPCIVTMLFWGFPCRVGDCFCFRGVQLSVVRCCGGDEVVTCGGRVFEGAADEKDGRLQSCGTVRVAVMFNKSDSVVVSVPLLGQCFHDALYECVEQKRAGWVTLLGSPFEVELFASDVIAHASSTIFVEFALAETDTAAPNDDEHDGQEKAAGFESSTRH